eukprot:1609038-Rhodomonas_salina.1
MLRAERIRVASLAGDAALLANLLGSQSHGQLDVLVVERGPERVLESEVVGKLGSLADIAQRVRGHGHVLGTAARHNLALAHGDVLGALHNGLEASAAKPVDGQGRGVQSHSRADADMAREVRGVLGGLGHVSEDDVINKGRVQVGLLQRSNGGDNTEICKDSVVRKPCGVRPTQQDADVREHNREKLGTQGVAPRPDTPREGGKKVPVGVWLRRVPPIDPKGVRFAATM